MNIKLGTLNIVNVLENEELLAPVVRDFLCTLPDTDGVGVAEIDSALSDTAEFCEHYQVGLEHVANCVILEAKRGDRRWLAACVVLGSTRADVNKLAKKTLDARKVSFAPMEKAVTESGMEYGAITPVGLPSDWPILVDRAVADSEYIIIGSGKRESKLVVPGNFLAQLPNVQVLEGLGQ